MEKLQIKRRQLCEWLWENTNTKKTNTSILISQIQTTYHLNEYHLNKIMKNITTWFLPHYERKWKSVHRS